MLYTTTDYAVTRSHPFNAQVLSRVLFWNQEAYTLALFRLRLVPRCFSRVIAQTCLLLSKPLSTRTSPKLRTYSTCARNERQLWITNLFLGYDMSSDPGSGVVRYRHPITILYPSSRIILMHRFCSNEPIGLMNKVSSEGIMPPHGTHLLVS